MEQPAEERPVSSLRERAWPKGPTILEVNAWVWLGEIAARRGGTPTLADVSDAEWDAIADRGIDAIWLMGVWERSPAGRAIALADRGLLAEYARALDDLRPEDVVGSPYAVRRYVVDQQLGGPRALAAARRRLAERGVRLMLDFVPNHVSVDHRWTVERPELLIRGDEADETRDPQGYFRAAGHVLAHGRDPYFPAWTDTAQLNVFRAELRTELARILEGIAGQCDGVRCDMAMLTTGQVFSATWGERAGNRPAVELWPELIRGLRRTRPGFLFVAEAYWGLEAELVSQGFDYCYDKALRDRLLDGDAEGLLGHLRATSDLGDRLIRFLENHDETRVAAAVGPERNRALAVAALSLPGARLLFQRQMEGARIRLPVQLGRAPDEPADAELAAFYRGLLAEVAAPVFREGEWAICAREGWPDNATSRHLVGWCWRHGEDRRLVVVNLAGLRAQARFRLPWPEIGARRWVLQDTLRGDRYPREGAELVGAGLYVDLAPYGWHVLEFRRG